MKDDKLQEIIELLPYSIRYSGEIEELLDYAREQAERVQELEEDSKNARYAIDMVESENKRLKQWKFETDPYIKSLEKQNKGYREALEEIARGRFPGASYKARKALEE